MAKSHTDGTKLPTDSEREERCSECNSRITIGQDGVEYGHQRGTRGNQTRCPRRPDCVDPDDKRGRRNA